LKHKRIFRAEFGFKRHIGCAIEIASTIILYYIYFAGLAPLSLLATPEFKAHET
jgi:hypothetical protein